ncbi:hypothetical protein CPY51_06255 [Rhizobium tubonense]|uniref:Uncharacterized protein n=1 Tax=Rhizobium tubonense TaxID=484088 RepID=A0A2W4F067_9HYPH|nr:hypothetical protein CPY51_06255 [Rhizobium tubonense]
MSATLASSMAFSPVASNEADDFKKVRGDCELAHMWKDPPDPKAFSRCMKDGHYALRLSPLCQFGARRRGCYELQN